MDELEDLQGLLEDLIGQLDQIGTPKNAVDKHAASELRKDIAAVRKQISDLK